MIFGDTGMRAGSLKCGLTMVQNIVWNVGELSGILVILV